MRNLRIKRVMRHDPDARLFRICRVMWERGTVGDGNGYSAKLSFDLQRKLLRWDSRSHLGWEVVAFGLRVRLRRAYGGIFV